MPSKSTNTGKSTTPRAGAIVTDEVSIYEKHPFFVKKANAAKAFLKKAGLPVPASKKRA